MTWHTMELTEANRPKAGFFIRYYAHIDVTLAGSDWHWHQVGLAAAPVSGPFPSEDAAKADALSKLAGDGWL